MKKTILAFAAVGAAALLAQSLTTPQPIDWRYQFQWDDPNPVGIVSSWTVYVSNTTSQATRTTSTRILSADAGALLSGQPAGTYALFNVAVSQLGDTSDASTNLYVSWPGGSGKVQPGRNERVNK